RLEEGIDYDEVFAPVAWIEAIRLFLAFVSYMGFSVYQMDVKNAFLYGTIEEEVYVHQPLGFVDPAHPNNVNKVYDWLSNVFDYIKARHHVCCLCLILISCQCKKQTIVANSTTEAEYVAAANCCGQVLWIQNQMMDYGFNFMNTKIHIDNESTISVIKNHVAHSKTKHIEIRFHFIRDCYEKRLIEVIKIHTNSNVADLLTKGFDVKSFKGEPYVHKDLAFNDQDDIINEATDYMESEDAQDEGRTSSMVLEEKENANKEVSAEAPKGTDKKNEEGITEAEKKFKQLANDEEVAKKVQEEWEAKEKKKRLVEEEATKAALSNEYDFIQERLNADKIL
ncbi:putative ribonuclease H-like domain-containing protein, partial [Tanacetum coccineum]